MLLNTTTQFNISPGQLKIDPKVIATLMGIEGPIPEPYEGIIARELEEIPRYENISGGYIIVDDIGIDLDNDCFSAKGKQFSPGIQVMKHLKGSEMLALYVCTAGEEVSIRSKELMNSGLMLEGYVTDLIGSVLVEEAMENIHTELKKALLKEDIRTTNRYYPGYCDWKVDEQHSLFSFFPENFCGVKLTPSALMNPVKSVSGVIGLGRKVKFHKYACNACPNLKCIYRNLKYRM